MNVEELSVLLIEDDSTWSSMGNRFLNRIGFRGYDTAESEARASQYFNQRKYDLVISDTMEGDTHPMGPNAVREAKKLGQNPVTVALSSSSRNERLWQGLADYFFLKHEFFSDEALIKRVLQEKFQINGK